MQPTIQDFTRIYSTLGLGKGTPSRPPLFSSFPILIKLSLARDRRCLASVPQVQLGRLKNKAIVDEAEKIRRV